MEFQFINEADMLGKAFWACAIAGTLFFLLRLGSMLITGTDGDDIDFDAGTDAQFQILSTNSITAFIMMFGWTGLTCYLQFALSPTVSILVALVVGVLSMVITALTFRLAMGLTSKGGSFDINDTIGQVASVYQTIPADGTGRVNISMPNGMLKMLDAYSLDKTEIPSFQQVKVLEVVDGKTVRVEPI